MIAKNTARKTGMPLLTIIIASIPDRDITAPTDRSHPRHMTARVTPNAIIKSGEATINMLQKCRSVKIFALEKIIMNKIIAIATSAFCFEIIFTACLRIF